MNPIGRAFTEGGAISAATFQDRRSQDDTVSIQGQRPRHLPAAT